MCTDKMQKVFFLYFAVVMGILFLLTLKARFLCPGIAPGGLGFLLPAVPRGPGAWVPRAFQAVRLFPPALTLGCMFSSADHGTGWKMGVEEGGCYSARAAFTSSPRGDQ